MRMNDHSGNISRSFRVGWNPRGSIGFTTQDMVYMFFGAVGLLISLISYVNGRIDARRKRKEDEKRTAMIRDYLDGISDKPIAERPAAVSVVADALTKAGE